MIRPTKLGKKRNDSVFDDVSIKVLWWKRRFFFFTIIDPDFINREKSFNLGDRFRMRINSDPTKKNRCGSGLDPAPQKITNTDLDPTKILKYKSASRPWLWSDQQTWRDAHWLRVRYISSPCICFNNSLSTKWFSSSTNLYFGVSLVILLKKKSFS